MPQSNVSELIADWIKYATDNSIKATSKNKGVQKLLSDGRPPEDTDLMKFLLDKGFDGEVVKKLIAELPEVDPVEGDAEEEPEQSTVRRSGGVEPESDIDFDDPKNARPDPEPETEPEVEVEPPRNKIETGETIRGDDGNAYKWMGKRWRSMDDYSSVEPDTAQALNLQYDKTVDDAEAARAKDAEDKEAQRVADQEKADQEKADADRASADQEKADQQQADADKRQARTNRTGGRRDNYDYGVGGISRSELDGIATDLDPDSEKTRAKERYLKSINTIVGSLSKKERQYLKKELKNG